MIPHVLERILIIDDEPSMVRALARLLARDGYIVATARNGRHALAALQGQGYDVILCDLRMPELDGRAFYTQLQQRAPLLCQRVIFLTGDIRAADHQLSRTSQELRQRSHALLGKVQTLYARSRHLRCQAARLRQQGRTVDQPRAS